MTNESVVQQLVVFDGICNLCNGVVSFIIKRDSQAKFRFTAMQSDYAQALGREYAIDNIGEDTFLLIKDGKCFAYSDAALEIARELDGCWYLCTAFKVVPQPIRDFFYRLLARNRYALFGKKDECMVPTPVLRKRFIS